MSQFMDLWYGKAFFAILLTIFAPVQASVTIVFIMIFIDTVTGSIAAIKQNRFNSRTFIKNFKKATMYATCILTIRLVELGVLYNFKTVALTQFIAGFLILTEAISVFENLSILGFTIPGGFLNTFYKQLRNGTFQEIVRKSQKEKIALKDMEDILYFQVPSIKSEDIRKMLETLIKRWLEISRELIKYFDGIQKEDNELLYYKVLSLVQAGVKQMQDTRTGDQAVGCMDNFKKCSEERISHWLNDIKEICFRIATLEKKKNEIIKKITILVYQTVLDAQKCESGILECELPEDFGIK